MQIRPITDLRNTTEISDVCHKTDEPIFITKNGYGDLVVMSITAYERDFVSAKLHASLMEGVRQAKAGEGKDAYEVLSKLRESYVRG